MKSVMLSIQPKWCELIASGEKTIEVRKTRPKIETPFRCYIYETKGKTETPMLIDEEGYEIYESRGQVIGEFVCDEIVEDIHGENARLFEILGCLPFEQQKKYSPKKPLYGWHISDLVIYDKPKEVSEFIHPSNGCCNEGKCRGCKYFDSGNGFNIEDDCNADFDTDTFSILKRPPQSWCYVEGNGSY